jgi:hypothetical protein
MYWLVRVARPCESLRLTETASNSRSMFGLRPCSSSDAIRPIGAAGSA